MRIVVAVDGSPVSARVARHVVPATEIVEACARHDADLLVMGSRGQGAVKSMLVGSVAMKVVAAGKTPVTLVR